MEVIRTPSLTINHFVKTQEGQLLINNQTVFCLGGKLYQAFKGAVITVREDQLSEPELENLYDVDQTKGKILTERRLRLAHRKAAREEELAERRSKALEKEAHALQVQKLRREMAEDEPQGASVADIDEISALKRQVKILQTENAALKEPGATTDHLEHACPFCQKRAPKQHKSPKKWLTGHKMQCKRKADASTGSS
jgi:hypothetical protein